MVEYINITTLENLDLNDKFYISNYPSRHRPHIEPNAPETCDVISISTKKVLSALFQIESQKYFDIYKFCREEKNRRVEFDEQHLYSLLDFINVRVVNDGNIKFRTLLPDGSFNIFTN